MCATYIIYQSCHLNILNFTILHNYFPGGYGPWSRKVSDTTEQLTLSLVLPVTERRVLKSPAIIVDLTVSPSIYFTVCSIHFKVMLLGAHPFHVLSSYKLSVFSSVPCLKNKPTCLLVQFCPLSFILYLQDISVLHLSVL